MSRPFKLYRLQQIDTQLDWIHNRLSEIERLLGEDAVVQQAAAEFAQKEQVHQTAQKQVRKAEDEVRQVRIKIEQDESSLYGGKIRNPKELKDLENEVAALKRHLTVVEDRQLEAMLYEEDTGAQTQVAAAGRDQAQSEFDQHTGDLRQEREKISKDQARLEGERQAAAEPIEAEDLAIYNQLRKVRRGVAVSKVTDRACSACGSTLSAALLNASHSPNQISRCEACGRILYIG
jgi:predicted  nucleic acid-binding Zn-ribbon protein